MKTYTVVSTYGEVIAVINREERNRLLGCNSDGTAPRRGAPELPLWPHGVPEFNQRMIQVHRKNQSIYFATVEPSTIRAELRRDIGGNRIPVAEDCTTTRKEIFSNHLGSGWYYEHHMQRSNAYAYAPVGVQTVARPVPAINSEPHLKAKVIPFPAPKKPVKTEFPGPPNRPAVPARIPLAA